MSTILYRISPTEFLVYGDGTSYRIIVLREDKRRRAILIEGSCWGRNGLPAYVLNLSPHRSEMRTLSRRSVADFPWETIE